MQSESNISRWGKTQNGFSKTNLNLLQEIYTLLKLGIFEFQMKCMENVKSL